MGNAQDETRPSQDDPGIPVIQTDTFQKSADPSGGGIVIRKVT